QNGGGQVSDETEIRAMVDRIVSGSKKQVEQYRSGKTALFGYFVGQVMKLSSGKANPQVVNKAVQEALDSKGTGS
ncbi:MAG: Asp-tRNA(Asn)/Glu-tRNA(Gln) amidotransferase subunit GatB, partial [Blastocatellia bacterium]